MSTPARFADVILPLHLPQAYTYVVPEALRGQAAPGQRVVVPLKTHKLYMGVIVRLHDQAPRPDTLRALLEIVDREPCVTPGQFKLWDWITSYYMSAPGDLLRATLPAGLKLEQLSYLEAVPEAELDELDLSLSPAEEKLLVQIRTSPNTQVANMLKGKPGRGSVLDRLIHRGLIQIHETLRARDLIRRQHFVSLAEGCRTPTEITSALERMPRAKSQQRLLLGLVSALHTGDGPLDGEIERGKLLQHLNISSNVLNALVSRGLVQITEREVSSLAQGEPPWRDFKVLSPPQRQALREIQTQHQTHDVVLLHGITGSGKTEIYIELIRQALERGKQALYIMPEIALTIQILRRLQSALGDRIGTYHSRQPERARLELYEALLHGRDQRAGQCYDVIVGARSSLLLPFRNLGLVIVDEEHESSYKQTNPAPRYQGRDTAIMLARQHGAKVVLGSATPSVTSYHNALGGKYGLVTLPERHGQSVLPEVRIIDIRAARRAGTMHHHFSTELIGQIRSTVASGGQAILLQNRRGYSPYVECADCGWVAQCPDCDVSLTLHKSTNALRCHYCNYQENIPPACPACGSVDLQRRGLGTQRVEEELGELLPECRVGRLDLDTTRTKQGAGRVIEAFENHHLDILVGTQMVSKGLDFSNVLLVGILDADGMLRHADFRATERGFQLLAQVGGRAGRRETRGIVMIQTTTPSHPLFNWVRENNFPAFFSTTIEERRQHLFPPFVRLIELKLRHRKQSTVETAAHLLAQRLRGQLGDQILGPQAPPIAWIARSYIMRILVKIPEPARNQHLSRVKELINESIRWLNSQRGFQSVRVDPDVDP